MGIGNLKLSYGIEKQKSRDWKVKKIHKFFPDKNLKAKGITLPAVEGYAIDSSLEHQTLREYQSIELIAVECEKRKAKVLRRNVPERVKVKAMLLQEYLTESNAEAFAFADWDLFCFLGFKRFVLDCFEIAAEKGLYDTSNGHALILLNSCISPRLKRTGQYRYVQRLAGRKGIEFGIVVAINKRINKHGYKAELKGRYRYSNKDKSDHAAPMLQTAIIIKKNNS